MASDSSLINREVLLVEVSSKDEYLKIKDEIEDLSNNKIPEMIEKLCSNIFSEYDVVRLDNIEIDLGIISPSDLLENLLQKFSSVFEDTLVKIKDDKKYVIDSDSSDFLLLTYFLNYGNLPWWADKNQIDLKQIFLRVLSENFDELISFLVEQKKIETVLSRIEYQISENVIMEFNQKLMKEYFSIFKNSVTFTKKLLSGILSSEFGQKSIEIVVAEVLLYVLRKKILISEQELVYKIFIGYLLRDRSSLDIKTLDSGWEVVEDKSVIGKNIMIIMEAIEKKIKLSSVELGDFIKRLSTKTITVNLSVSKKSASIEYQDKSEEILSDKPEDKLEEIYVSNAGISLIAIYLPILFDKIHLLENGVFKNRGSANRAALLINYLTHNKTEDYEFNLQLNKILCGIPGNETLPKQIEITEEEIEQIDALLTSVIKNWTAIKNTSIEGLRTAFLQREGILYDEVGSFKLKVDRKPHDVILETIPWSISIINFNWMIKPVYVEW